MFTAFMLNCHGCEVLDYLKKSGQGVKIQASTQIKFKIYTKY
ncbi:hypothetical protein ABWED_0016 [Acinetobacter lwoffii]|nr:hypothetical protein ABWED_0016 [Acinetobacter lwoffii]